jgi:hypothetical protein
MRSHALAFATAPWSADDAEAARRREPPPLRMRREERGEWDDGLKDRLPDEAKGRAMNE